MANNFPNLLPSLNIDMVNGIYVDPRITFTRAGTRTYYGQEMVKAEENLVLQSQTLDNASWDKSQLITVVAGTEIAPDGTATAEAIIPNTNTNQHYIAQGLIAPAASVVTLSVYAKANGYDYLGLQIGIVGANRFDLNAGTVLGVGWDSGVPIAPATITDAGGGWYRCSITVTTVAAASLYIGVWSSSSSLANYAGDGTSGLFLWGAQLEQRSSATAYTATTTQPITNYQRQLKTAAANEWPREFDPVTGECLGRSVWESRTNLLTYSEEFDNAAWTNNNITILPNQIIAPDGTLSADKFVADTSNSAHGVRVGVTSGQSRAYSVFAKAGEYGYLSFGSGNPGKRTYFNLITGTVGGASSGSGLTSPAITNVGNGWYRCSGIVASSGGEFIIRAHNTGSGAETYTGDGYSGIYIWGAQLEAGAFATPYIPTVAAQVTRVADSAVMTGVNFSSWFNPSEGALFVESSIVAGATGNRAVFISDGTASNRISNVVDTSANSGAQVLSGNVTQVALGDAAVASVTYKQSFSYKFNDFAFCRDGGAVSTDTSGVVPVVSQLGIGTITGSTVGNGYYTRVTYYNQALTAANLQAVTR